MKVRNYAQAIKARGYKTIATDRQESLFVKEHSYNTVYCTVFKDAHGKGKHINFMIVKHRNSKNELNKEECEFDNAYLKKEANVLIRVFEELKKLKNPKCAWL